MTKRKLIMHGMTGTPEYASWYAMRRRCTSRKGSNWINYGGRGIKVCDRWLNDPRAFLEDMGAKPSPDHQIDRINNDGDYEPENCRWVLPAVNNRNRRANVNVTFQGQTKILADWCAELGLSRSAVYCRLKKGWSIEDAFTKPVRQISPKGTRIDALRHPCARCGEPITMRAKHCRYCSNKARALPLRKDRMRRPCPGCSKPITLQAKFCITCSNKARALPIRKNQLRHPCLDCGKPITMRAQRCNPCTNKHRALKEAA